jgi:hypothetical protein
MIDPDREFLSRITGEGRVTNRMRTLANVILALTTAASSGWAVMATKAAEDRVERLLVVLDGRANVVDERPVSGGEVIPTDIMREFALTWIERLRSRSEDVKRTSDDLRWIADRADMRVAPKIQTVAFEAREDGGRNPRDILAMSGHVEHRVQPGKMVDGRKVEDPAGDEAKIKVWWTEKERLGQPEAQSYVGILTVLYVRPTRKQQAERNVVGLFVTELDYHEEVK